MKEIKIYESYTPVKGNWWVDLNQSDRPIYRWTDDGWILLTSGGGGGDVNKLIGGTNITVSPGSGTGNVTINSTVSKTSLGLDKVQNTTDLEKVISTQTQAALNLKADIASLATVATTGNYNDLINAPTFQVSSFINSINLTATVTGINLLYDNVNMFNGTTVPTTKEIPAATSLLAGLLLPAEKNLLTDSTATTLNRLATLADIGNLEGVHFAGPYDDEDAITTPYELNAIYLVGLDEPYSMVIATAASSSTDDLLSIGSTSVDLTAYYTKTESDARYIINGVNEGDIALEIEEGNFALQATGWVSFNPNEGIFLEGGGDVEISPLGSVKIQAGTGAAGNINLNSDVIIAAGKKIFGVNTTAQQHELIGLNEYPTGEQVEVGTEAAALCLNHKVVTSWSTKNIAVNYKDATGTEIADKVAYLSDLPSDYYTKDEADIKFASYYAPANDDYSIEVPLTKAKFDEGGDFELGLQYDDGADIVYPDFLAVGPQPTLPDETLGTDIKLDFGDTQTSTRIRSHERPVVWLNETPTDPDFPNGHFLAYLDDVTSLEFQLVIDTI